ncbi:hypothetical protein [Bradyrhizobium sp. CCBAU 45384]|uniref:hypothetical protein n=1 Tax=Bradyrhizobium sp. CCBAU 45384 TaxID=858428 RepID=UPI002305B566|nr:hypothetical protein [Bradyrhizobium sp. CCBAU 45384]
MYDVILFARKKLAVLRVELADCVFVQLSSPTITAIDTACSQPRMSLFLADGSRISRPRICPLLKRAKSSQLIVRPEGANYQ